MLCGKRLTVQPSSSSGLAAACVRPGTWQGLDGGRWSPLLDVCSRPCFAFSTPEPSCWNSPSSLSPHTPHQPACLACYVFELLNSHSNSFCYSHNIRPASRRQATNRKTKTGHRGQTRIPDIVADHPSLPTNKTIVRAASLTRFAPHLAIVISCFLARPASMSSP